MSQDIKKLFADRGFAYPDNLIMAFIGGSTQHGAVSDEPNGSDVDYYGVFIPPAHTTLGLDHDESFSYPPQDIIDQRSRGERIPGDMDIALHSLQKWAGMAATGNPTVLSFLFAKPKFTTSCSNVDQRLSCNPCGYGASEAYDIGDDSDHTCNAWSRVLIYKHLFISKHHVWPFIKYAEAQMERLLGLRGQKNVNRDYLDEKYGYDTKYAMHIIRLLVEGRDLMETGQITYPNLKVDLLKDIRRGKLSLTDINNMVTEFKADAIRAAHMSQLPESVDRDKISRLVADIHLEFYGQ